MPQQDETLKTQDTASEEPEEQKGGRTCRRVLLAEDDPDAAANFRTVFGEPPSWEVAWFDNGADALDFALRQGDHTDAWAPDLVVSCISMPRMIGLEVLKHIKQAPDRALVPVVIWTVSERLEDIERAYVLGAAGYFVKPFDSDVQRRQLRVIRAFWEGARPARSCPRKPCQARQRS